MRIGKFIFGGKYVMSAVGTQCGVRSTKTDLKNDKFEIKIPEFHGSAENSHACN